MAIETLARRYSAALFAVAQDSNAVENVVSEVDAVVAAHGGSVEVSSVPGRTAFTVRLPVHS